MHQQRLAAAGRAPVGNFIQLWPRLCLFVKGGNLVGFWFVRVVGSNLGIQRLHQALRVAKISIQVDLGKKKRQILEILPGDRLFPTRDAPVVEAQSVLHDVLVVFEKQLRGQLCQIEELRGERMMKMMDVVLVQALHLFVAEVFRQLLKPLNVEERKQPLG